MCVDVEGENTENNFKDENELGDTNKEEMVIHKRVHIIKRDEGWAIKKEGASRAIRIYESKREAVEEARIFKKRGYDLVIHSEDGSVQRWEKSQKRHSYKVITRGVKTTIIPTKKTPPREKRRRNPQKKR
ncbi:MAG: DUF2188 domain-containing protein [Methanophagales archaeon]|nr:DUF2188 domain-containing protein [Methanophagales archaeon]